MLYNVFRMFCDTFKAVGYRRLNCTDTVFRKLTLTLLRKAVFPNLCIHCYFILYVLFRVYVIYFIGQILITLLINV